MDYFYRFLPRRIRLGSVALSAAAMLLAACGGGGSSDGGTSSPPPPAPPPPPPPAPSGTVTISGLAAYEFVPPNLNCQGLDFASTVVRPIRGATVQLVDSSNTELARTVSGDDGSYSFAGVESNTDVRIRVRAELKRTGAPSWDVEVRDNVLSNPDDPNAPALVDRPLYAIVTDFNTGSTDLTRNLTARSGWDGSSYTGTRSAAPFAVLDSIYTAMQLIIGVEPAATFNPLDAYWSVNNTLSSPTDIDAGELGASFYSPDPDRNGSANPSLFLLGDAAVDTEEFDDHVIVHEWGHYFEDNFARSDSTGGPHGIGDKLDARLAFGEGWATALSGIALDNPIYCDTGPAGSSGGFGIGTEKGAYDAQGWYDEISVLRFIYDLWDTTDDEAEGLNTGADTGSIGFAPIYETMVGPQAFTETFTTVFSFASELRSMLVSQEDRDFLDSQLVREDMTPGFDKWGVGELNDASPDGQQSRDVLPLYVEMPVDGTVVNICTNDDYDGAGDGNKLATFRYLRLDMPTTSAYDVRVITTTTGDLPADDPLDERDQSDPDLFIFRDGRVVDFGNSGEANQEIFTTAVLSGPDTYVADLQEFRYADPESPVGFPDRMCFDVSFTPVP
jgi:hypothetical protein